MVAAEQAEAVIQSVRTNKEILKEKISDGKKIINWDIIIPSHAQTKWIKEISQ